MSVDITQIPDCFLVSKAEGGQPISPGASQEAAGLRPSAAVHRHMLLPEHASTSTCHAPPHFGKGAPLYPAHHLPARVALSVAGESRALSRGAQGPAESPGPVPMPLLAVHIALALLGLREGPCQQAGGLLRPTSKQLPAVSGASRRVWPNSRNSYGAIHGIVRRTPPCTHKYWNAVVGATLSHR